MLENDNGCDRCRDYDKVREELENTKRKSTEDQKNALKRCEDSKSQLQKKLLSVGAAAVIGGTILGKDLVDKIAEYIESFNTVKNAASGLVGMADPPVDVPIVEVKEEPKEVKEEPKKKPKAKPKFTRKPPKLPKKKKSKPTYVPLTDSELNEMVAGHILGNPNTIVTSMQIASHYVTSAKKRYEMTTVATQELNSIESRIVAVLQKIADVFGPSQSMSMPIAPNGLQVALFAKKKPTVAQLVEKLQ